MQSPVSVETDTGFSAEPPVVLFEDDYNMDLVGAGIPNYDVSPDGRFLMIRTGDGDAPETGQATIVLNWTQELLERVPVP